MRPRPEDQSDGPSPKRLCDGTAPMEDQRDGTTVAALTVAQVHDRAKHAGVMVDAELELLEPEQLHEWAASKGLVGNQ